MSRRFNRESNLRILQRLEQEQREKEERVNKLVVKFNPQKKKAKFVSDCENEYEFCESRFKKRE